jgi:hypothetical protein
MSKTKFNKNIFYNEFKPDFLILIKEFPDLKKYIIKQNEENKEEIYFDWSNNDLSLLSYKNLIILKIEIVQLSNSSNFSNIIFFL